MSSVPVPEPASPARRRLRLLLLLLVIAGAAVAFHYGVPARLRDGMKTALDWLQQLGFWAPVVFVLLYVVSCVAMLPASILTIGAGAVFDLPWGIVYVWIGATLGAAAAFLVSRHVARDWVTRRFGQRPTFVAIDRAVAEEGWKIVFLTRLSPVFPYFILNYLYGLTRVRFSHYVLATWIGIIPGSTLFVFIGYTLRQAGTQSSTQIDWLKYGFILVTGIIATVYLAKIAKRALAKRMEQPDSDPVRR